jgi:hypothetical protein
MRTRAHGDRSGSDRVSQLPRLSPRGRAVLARIELTRLWPRAAEQALGYWRDYQRDPDSQRWDRPDDCGQWFCCPDIDEIRMVLGIVEHNLPARDARLFRAELTAAGGDPP